ncbi:MAG: alpha-amylase, partial [Anaerolineae bacterium]
TDIFAYRRTAANANSFLVALNFGDIPHTLNLSHIAPQGEIALSTGMRRAETVNFSHLQLNSNEGLCLRL